MSNETPQKTPYPPPSYTPNAPGHEYPPGYNNPSPGYGPAVPPPQSGYGPPSTGFAPAQPPPPPGYVPVPLVSTYPPGPGPITSQPGAQQMVSVANQGWMNIPQGIPNCPPGLEYLTMIDKLLVKQKVEILEVVLGWESKNKYTIKNSAGQKVYYAKEDSDCCSRNCCGPARPFDMQILDNFQHEVIHLHRPLACQSCCFPCCLQSMEVSAPPGNIVGSVEQEWSICCPTFAVKNPSGDTVLRIEGPFCTTSICGSDVEFQIMSSDGQVQVGKICKKWSGLGREAFTDADYFGISFPMDLDVRMKAVMLGACFLIDAMFFEQSSGGMIGLAGACAE